MESNKKKIFWLTADNFIDVDLPLIPRLSDTYEIHWYIYMSKNSYKFTHDNIYNYIKEEKYKKADITVFCSNYRYRSLKTLIQYIKIALMIKKNKYDLVYIDMLGAPYLFFVFWSLKVKNITYACHDFIEHLNIKRRWIMKNYQAFIFDHFHNFQLFSANQLRLFKQKYPDKNYFYASLCLKDFGPSDATPDSKRVVFTFFGFIRENKGLEYLIQAGNLLARKYTNQDFIIRIYGYHPNWEEKYGKLIEDPSIFDLNISRIPNEEIPDIYCSTHYLMLPYIDVTQSGPLFIAYNYNVPVIASDLEGFTEYVKHEETGFLFENKNPVSLYKIMEQAIEQHDKYATIKKNLNLYIKQNLLLESIITKYINYFGFFQ